MSEEETKGNVVTTTGNIYGWGSDRAEGAVSEKKGVAVAGNKKNFADSHVIIPTKLKGATGVISCSSFAEFSMALKKDGTVFTWGTNSRGRCGHPTASQAIP